jgi:hypothetical protein
MVARVAVPDDEGGGFVGTVLILGREEFATTLLQTPPCQTAISRSTFSVRRTLLTFLR